MSEEPKHPEKIGDIIGRLFTARGWGRRNDQLRLERLWREVVGPEHANDTRVKGLNRGVLEVEVRGTVRMQELSQFHKRRLMSDLKKVLGEKVFKELRFRSASWE